MAFTSNFYEQPSRYHGNEASLIETLIENATRYYDYEFPRDNCGVCRCSRVPVVFASCDIDEKYPMIQQRAHASNNSNK